MFFNTQLVRKLKIICLLSNFNVSISHQIEPNHGTTANLNNFSFNRLRVNLDQEIYDSISESFDVGCDSLRH